MYVSLHFPHIRKVSIGCVVLFKINKSIFKKYLGRVLCQVWAVSGFLHFQKAGL